MSSWLDQAGLSDTESLLSSRVRTTKDHFCSCYTQGCEVKIRGPCSSAHTHLHSVATMTLKFPSWGFWMPHTVSPPHTGCLPFLLTFPIFRNHPRLCSHLANSEDLSPGISTQQFYITSWSRGLEPNTKTPSSLATSCLCHLCHTFHYVY